LLRGLLWTCVVVVVLVVGGWLAFYLFGTSRLDKARAEADQLDPGWRFAELQEKRAIIPELENAALLVDNLHRSIPRGWPTKLWAPGTDADGLPTRPLEESLQPGAANELLPEEYIIALRSDLEEIKALLDQGRKLADMPRGRLPIREGDDHLTLLLNGVQEFRGVANLFMYEARARAQENDGDGALVSVRAVFNSGRAIGDEPIMIAQLVRFAILSVGTDTAERVLGLSQSSEDELAKLQKLLEDELEEPCLLQAFRGERAFIDYTNGTMTPSGRPPAGGGGIQPSSFAGWHQEQLAQVIHELNNTVEIAKLPLKEQRASLSQAELAFRKKIGSSLLLSYLYLYPKLLMPAVYKVSEAYFRNRAMIGCLVLALAAERYRLQHGKWPEKIEDLQPFVKKLPVDPFGKGPLKLRRIDDGIVIYSVGCDEEDNGGFLKRDRWMDKGVDLGVRLWDVEKRRQRPRKNEESS
jgi:hypothetical protein